VTVEKKIGHISTRTTNNQCVATAAVGATGALDAPLLPVDDADALFMRMILSTMVLA